MSKVYKKLFALVCAAVLLAGTHGLPVFAASGRSGNLSGTEPLVLTCTEIPLYIDNMYIGSGIVVDSVAYVPLLAFTEYILQDACEVQWDQETGTAQIASETLDLSLTTDQPYMTVNGRYVWFEDGVYNINGTIVAPIRELARIFSLDLTLDREEWAILIDAGNSRVPEGGDEFYDEDDLYWLSRAISSEAGNQPLKGMIGVGNVILNRVNDDSGAFSDTVTNVIFQYGQFDVVRTGAIYQEPSDIAVVAAKLCLEGYNTVGESKWFVNPSIARTGWFDIHRTFEVAIADHLFYT